MIVTDLGHVIPGIVQSAEDRADRAERAKRAKKIKKRLEWSVVLCKNTCNNPTELPCTSDQGHAGQFIPVLPGEPEKRTERVSSLPNYLDQYERNHALASEVP